MVGVPRSKGCVNCRRRKVACDQRKPSCEICIKRGDRCEGYAKYPVILQWSPSGLKKRHRFEEVVTSESFVSPSDNSLGSFTAKSSTDPPREQSFTIRVNSGHVVLQQIQVRSLESYLPRTGNLATEAQNSWMWSLVTISDPGRALGPAMAALGMSRIGMVLKDEDLMRGARVQYGVALTELQNALYDPVAVFQDRTLGAIRALSIFEIFNPTSGTVPSDRSHADGMSQWCLAAGAQSINTEFALQIFHDVRWFLMIKAIERRKSSVLGNEDWRTVPWQSCAKDSLQQIFDVGFKLAAFLEQTDTSPQFLHVCARLAYQREAYFTISEELELWYNDFLASQIETFGIDEIHDGLTNHQPGDTSFDFKTLWQASNFLYYWGFKLVLNDILITSFQSSTAAIEHANNPTPYTLTRKLPPSDNQRHKVIEGAIPPRTLPIQEDLATTNLQLAANIVHSTPYFLQNDMGWMGPMRLFNPLQQAAAYLSKVDSMLYPEAQAALTRLYFRLTSK